MKMERGIVPRANEWRQFLEARKCKETGSPLQPPEGTQFCQHLDFNPVRLISGFLSPEL